MKTFHEWLKENLNEVSKPAGAAAGWLLGGPVGAVIGHHLGQDEKGRPSVPGPERKSSAGWSSQGVADLSPEELLRKGVIEGQIVRDIYRKDGRSVETVLPNGVKIVKFIGHVSQVPRDMVNLGVEELLGRGVIQGKVIKDEVKQISPGVKERWITTKSDGGIETIKFIGNVK